jgi:hypothetical protein
MESYAVGVFRAASGEPPCSHVENYLVPLIMYACGGKRAISLRPGGAVRRATLEYP